MKIAMPTDDGTLISNHFGRSASFLIYEIENGKVIGREVRQNGMHHTHEAGQCGPSSPASGPHSHAGILTALEGCDLVICAGMGEGAATALRARGMEILRVLPAPAEDTVAAYLAGNLPVGEGGFCHCRH
jgi:predicted Fe-Mo cluster-binding NifX family protein